MKQGVKVSSAHPCLRTGELPDPGWWPLVKRHLSSSRVQSFEKTVRP